MAQDVKNYKSIGARGQFPCPRSGVSLTDSQRQRKRGNVRFFNLMGEQQQPLLLLLLLLDSMASNERTFSAAQERRV